MPLYSRLKSSLILILLLLLYAYYSTNIASYKSACSIIIIKLVVIIICALQRTRPLSRTHCILGLINGLYILRPLDTQGYLYIYRLNCPVVLMLALIAVFLLD